MQYIFPQIIVLYQSV